MTYGDTPHIVRGWPEDYRRLFYSNPDHAQKRDISIPAGMGIIPAGAVMAKITESTNRLGYYVPYTPETLAAALPYRSTRGLAYLVQDGADNAYVYVAMADSYKFAVGDHLAVGDSDTAAASNADLGAITAIDRTTYSHIAKITVTNALASSFTVANGAAVWIQSNTSAPYVKAVGILMAAVDTGEGENAKGGTGVLILGNAMLYKDLLTNYDSEALTDMSWAREDNNLLIM